MIKKWWWQLPLVLTGSVAVGVGIGFGSVYMQNANPFREYGRTPVTGNDAGIIEAYDAAIANGSKLLVLPGFTHKSPLIRYLDYTPSESASHYKLANQAGYLLLDDTYGIPVLTKDGKWDNNLKQPLFTNKVACAMFRTDLGSFITGIAIGQFLNDNAEVILKDKGRDYFEWATYGGLTPSNVTGYMGGFQRGIHWFNENLAFEDNEWGYKPLKQVFLGSRQQENFSGGFGPTQGDQLIDLFLAKNIDLFIPVAGPQTQAAVNRINLYKRKTFVIGVDSAAETDMSVNAPLETIPGMNVIPFSSVKRLDEIGAQVMNNINTGVSVPHDTTVGGFGYISLGTPQNGGVGVSEAGQSYFVKAMKNLHPQIPDGDYDKAVQELEKNHKEFTDLMENSNQIYYAYNGWWEDKPAANGTNSWSYDDLPESGVEMLPMYDEKEFNEWFNISGNEMYKPFIPQINKWRQDRESMLKARADFSLENELTAEQYERYEGTIKVIVNSPDSPLLDNSFAETSLAGILLYWWKYQQITDLPTIPK